MIRTEVFTWPVCIVRGIGHVFTMSPLLNSIFEDFDPVGLKAACAASLTGQRIVYLDIEPFGNIVYSGQQRP